jgi:hypothetical protein
VIAVTVTLSAVPHNTLTVPHSRSVRGDAVPHRWAALDDRPPLSKILMLRLGFYCAEYVSW